MGRGKRYTEDEKLNLVSVLIANGYKQRKGAMLYTEKKTGVEHRTLAKYYKTVDIDKLEVKIMELKELIQTELQGIFQEMVNKRSNANYQNLVVAAGILIDKYVVLDGGVTNRTENVTKDWKVLVEMARQESLPDKSNDVVYLPDETKINVNIE